MISSPSPKRAQPIQKPFFHPQFWALSVGWLTLILLVRLGELLWLAVWQSGATLNAPLIGQALMYDARYFWQTSAGLFVLFTGFSVVSLRAARRAYLTACVLLTLAHLGLVVYFSKTSVLLGADLYGYDAAEIRQTVGSEGGLSWLILLALVVAVAGVTAALRLAPRFVGAPGRSSVAGLVGVAFLSLLLPPNSFVHAPEFANDYANSLSDNKSLHFLTASLDHFGREADGGPDIYADSYIAGSGPATAAEELRLATYLDEQQYPFLHRDETPDVLSPFFQAGAAKPNVVLIVVEGLGRAFSGEDAYLGSFTPFLDSLAQKSLYWNNFLSQGGRTFAALPSLLGSLPFAQHGFADLGPRMPEHLSLTGVLKRNGYRTAFYYGGNSSFDNMNPFLRKEGIDRIADEASFSPAYRKMPAANGFSWGYGDKDLFDFFLAQNNPADATPKLQVLLTVSTHSPFRYEGHERFEQRFEQRLNELSLSADEKAARREYRDELASVMYLDDALRQLMDRYRQRPDFARTVFLITGDHRMPEIPMVSKVDRYHVPLLVYSPLLKQSARFRSVSGHYDVAPSLLALLRTQYGLRTPSVASWVGTGLDTTRAFRNVHAYPMMMTKVEMVDYVMGRYLLNEQSLYRLSDNLQMEPVNDEAAKSRLENAFARFKQQNARIGAGTRMLPDSVR
ncbi:LTA synthase family protein [Tellurirhabdus rosea]|uniref:LTA synthase family protein n=1 Tax=Tellurirhabdus rosea TaxID=2674997 RepID=UPI002251E01E|nr:LTA synthase family protein [Tellurirhabdus rosea]